MGHSQRYTFEEVDVGELWANVGYKFPSYLCQEIELMQHNLPLVGIYWLYLPLTLLSILFLLYVWLSCRQNGPTKWMESPSFFIPNIYTVVLCILVFFAPSFWPTFLVYVLSIFLVQYLGFNALKAAIEDKTGLGVVMASGFVVIYSIGMIFIIKGIKFGYTQIFG